MSTKPYPDVPEHIQLGMRLESIFMPFARKARDEFYNANKRFVHYTSADAALKIIRSKRLWMRNTNCMADYREVQHGFDILLKYFSQTAKRDGFTQTLDACVPGVATAAIKMFDQWWHDTRFHTYIASISEHNDDEDTCGRLSMWRGFGSAASRVALIFRIPFYAAGAAEALNTIFSPVAYLPQEEAHQEIELVIQNIQDNTEFLRQVNPAYITNMTFVMLIAGAVCLKHRGFREEREWRVIYAPNRSASPLIKASTEVIGGIPQIVYQLPLDKDVSETLAELDIARIFDRLIIGPSQYAWPMWQAFVEALKQIGIADAEKRVHISDIPIRS